MAREKTDRSADVKTLVGLVKKGANTRGAICENTGWSPSVWTAVRDQALAEKKIKQVGEKKGTTYTLT